MPPILFYLFTALMIGAGAGVVLNRNPVSSALCLVVSFVGLAALYISLDAYFLGTIQILVYAGAVMVLFLFIIMLMDIKAETRRKFNLTAVFGGALLVLGFVAQLGGVVGSMQGADQELQPLNLAAAAEEREKMAAGGAKLDPSITKDLKDGTLPDVKLVGETLYTKYNFHLQIVGVLLLAATVGVVVLSRREDKTITKTPGGDLP